LTAFIRRSVASAIARANNDASGSSLRTAMIADASKIILVARVRRTRFCRDRLSDPVLSNELRNRDRSLVAAQRGRRPAFDDGAPGAPAQTR
jgi:hypothetical protein